MGTSIARIFRDRTIREFVEVILVPSVVGFVWFAVFSLVGNSEPR